jgi:hypothetical protein
VKRPHTRALSWEQLHDEAQACRFHNIVATLLPRYLTNPIEMQQSCSLNGRLVAYDMQPLRAI